MHEDLRRLKGGLLSVDEESDRDHELQENSQIGLQLRRVEVLLETNVEVVGNLRVRHAPSVSDDDVQETRENPRGDGEAKRKSSEGVHLSVESEAKTLARGRMHGHV